MPRVDLLATDYASRAYRITAPAAIAATLRFHQFYLPQWRVALEGRPLDTYPSTELGLLTVELPPNANGRLEVTFAQTPVEQAGLWLSLLAGLACLWLWRGRGLAVLVALGLVAGLIIAWPAAPAPLPRAVGAQVGDAAELVAVRTDRADYRPGDTALITLTWLARRPTAENFKSFVHVGVPDGTALIAQSDGDPGGGFTPASRWAPGEIVEDTRALAIPADAAPGSLPLFAGLYRFQTLQNLQASRGGVSFADNRVPIGELRVVAR